MRLDALFQEKGFPGIVAQILMLVDENLALRAMDGRELPVKCPRCGKSLFVLDGYRSRRFGTRLGTVELPSAHRAKCRHCGHSCVPLFLLCGIGRHQSASDGLQKMAIEQCVETSYRRAAGNLRALAGVVRSHTSFHRWVLKTDADEIKVPEDAVDAIREPAAEERGPPGEDSGAKKEPASLRESSALLLGALAAIPALYACSLAPDFPWHVESSVGRLLFSVAVMAAGAFPKAANA